MKFVRLASISFLMLVFCASAAFSQSEKQNVIAAARALETAPITKENAGITSNALKWLIETDEVSLIVCGGTFQMFSDKKNKHSSLMTMAYTIGMGAYKLQHPDDSEDAVQLAGLETALKAYEAAVTEKPKTRSPQIDALLAKRSTGELAAAVKAADCGKK